MMVRSWLLTTDSQPDFPVFDFSFDARCVTLEELKSITCLNGNVCD